MEDKDSFDFGGHSVGILVLLFKVGFSSSKKICIICFIESPLKMTKNIFYFILKPLFVPKIFKFLS